LITVYWAPKEQRTRSAESIGGARSVFATPSRRLSILRLLLVASDLPAAGDALDALFLPAMTLDYMLANGWAKQHFRRRFCP